MIIRPQQMAIAPRPESKPHFSPSQIKTARDCPRKWHGESVCGWKQPESDSQAKGKRVHRVLQEYLEGTLDRELTVAVSEDAILLPALRYFPAPNTPYLLCEQEIYIPAKAFDTVKPLYGFFDVVVLIGYDEETEEEILWVYDLKTTSNFAYMKSEEELSADPQALIYGWAALLMCLERLGISHEKVRFRHVYAHTKDRRGACSDVTLTVDQLREGLQQLAPFCRQMAEWEVLPFDQVPQNLNACGKYGGCHLKPECAKLGAPVYGDSPARAAFARLAITREDPVAHQENTMSSAFDEALKRRQARGAAGAAAMSALMGAAPAAAPAATPEPPKTELPPDDVNPPDGDAQGESGLVSAPVADSAPEGEEDEAPATPAPAPNPDAGYVPQSQVLPPAADKPAGRKGRQTSTYTRAQHKLAELADNAPVMARLRGIDNALLAAMLSGKAPKSAEATDAETVLQILDAAEKNQDLVLDATPVLAEGNKRSDALRTKLEAAKVAVVAAKDHLAKATQRTRELEDAGDDEASEKYRSEVRVPAQRAVKSAEEAVSQLTAQLQAAEAQEAEEAENARKALEVENARKAVAAAATAKEQQINEAPAVVGAGLQKHPGAADAHAMFIPAGSTILVRGAAPTREMRHVAVHIDDIINPYRRRAETQAMTVYYGSMKTDSYAQICALLLGDLQTNSFKLPALLCAPAMCSPLQERVLEALSPYLFESFAPMR